MFGFNEKDLLALRVRKLELRMNEMALNLSGLQQVVPALVADVTALIELYKAATAAAENPADQTAIDAVAKSLTDLEAAVVAAKPPAAAPAG